MKALTILSLYFLCFLPFSSKAQFSHSAQSFYLAKEKYSYQAVSGDPAGAQVFTLDNGFQLWILPDPFVPGVEARIVVRAGSIQDPEKAKGTAFLTAQLLKFGTDRLGTTDYGKEKTVLDSIADLLENWKQRGTAIDQDLARGLCTRQNEIACYAQDPLDEDVIGPESRISPDYTSFHFSLREEKLNKGLSYMAELFRNPVFRGIDRVLQQGNANNPVAEEYAPSVLEGLFPNHPYGKFPLAGTSEDFSHPSITEMRKYFQQWYGPNNMALILRGNLNSEEVIRLVDSTFGKLGRRDVQFNRFPKWSAEMPKTLASPQIHEGSIIFRGKGMDSRDPAGMELIAFLFQVLVEEESDRGHLVWKDLPAPLFTTRWLRDATLQTITSTDLEKRFTATEVELAITEILNRLKTGEFEDWQIREAADRAEKFRSEKVNALDWAENAYGIGWDWTDYLNRFDWMRSLGKQEIQQIAGSTYAHFAVATAPSKSDASAFQSPLPQIDYLDGICFPRNDWEKALAQMPPCKNCRATRITKDYAHALRDSAGNQSIWVEQQDSALFALEMYLNRAAYPWIDWSGECAYLYQLGNSTLFPDSIRRYFRNGQGIEIQQDAQYVRFSVSGLSKEFDTMLRALTDLLGELPNPEFMAEASEKLANNPPAHYPFAATWPNVWPGQRTEWPAPSQSTPKGLEDSLLATLDHWRHLPQGAYLRGNLAQRNKVLQWMADYRRSPKILPPQRSIIYLCNGELDSTLHFSWFVPLQVDLGNADHRERIAMRELLQLWPTADFAMPDGLPPYVLAMNNRNWWTGVSPVGGQTLCWEGDVISLTPVADLKALAKEIRKYPADPERLQAEIDDLRTSDEPEKAKLRSVGLNFIPWHEWPRFITQQVALGYLCGDGDYLVEQRYMQDAEHTLADMLKAWQKYFKPDLGTWYIRVPKHLFNPELFKELGEVRLVK